MRITEIKCETAAGFALPAAGHGPAPWVNREIREARLSLSAPGEKGASAHFSMDKGAGPWPAAPRVAVMLLSAFILAACAPTIHLDAPAMPTLDPQHAASDCTTALNSEKAPLDPMPQLPDVGELSPCPPGSGFVRCFTLDQDIVRQRRFKILHDDRDYCRDAYQRAITRGDGGAAK
jgi:hypothetical protein